MYVNNLNFYLIINVNMLTNSPADLYYIQLGKGNLNR